MTAENIIGFVIYALVALFMMGIGIVQLKSKDPVGSIRVKNRRKQKISQT